MAFFDKEDSAGSNTSGCAGDGACGEPLNEDGEIPLAELRLGGESFTAGRVA